MEKLQQTKQNILTAIDDAITTPKDIGLSVKQLAEAYNSLAEAEYKEELIKYIKKADKLELDEILSGFTDGK